MSSDTLVSQRPVRNRYLALGLFLFWSIAFSVAFTQWPLFSENQNTKFLHGLADAGFGYLSEDWLANTLDPLPAFSLLVNLTVRLLDPGLFYAYQALLLGVYLYSMAGIAASVFPAVSTRSGLVVFLIVLIALHASLLPPFSWPVLGVSLGWLLQAGVANQYLFNPVFQPATFGVLLILSIYLFLRGRPYWAALVAALAPVFHSTYLPGAAILTTAYVLVTAWDQKAAGRTIRPALGPALGIGALALAVVLPVLVYNAVVFTPTTAEAWQRAQEIIVEFRIPHHSLPEIWIDSTVYAKIGIVGIALVLVRKSRLFPIMLLAFLGALLFSALQMLTSSDTLAFIAPWRISVFLVPLSSAMIVAFLLSAVLKRFPRLISRYERVVIALSLLALLALVGRGALAIRDSFEAQAHDDAAAMMDFVRNSKAPGQVYLTPTYLAEFRLHTGAPQLVTFKSHPYKDLEVIEWQERVLASNEFYASPDCEKLGALADRFDISHAVVETSQLESGCPGAIEVHRDERFRVLELRPLQ